MYLWACSGPNAAAIIAGNEDLAYRLACAASVIVLISGAEFYFARRYLPIPLFNAFLLAIHPAWTIGARIGDCGSFMVGASWFVALGGVLLVTFQSMRAMESLSAWNARQQASDAQDDSEGTQ